MGNKTIKPPPISSSDAVPDFVEIIKSLDNLSTGFKNFKDVQDKAAREGRKALQSSLHEIGSFAGEVAEEVTQSVVEGILDSISHDPLIRSFISKTMSAVGVIGISALFTKINIKSF